jgi:hypothetical protein
LKRELKTHPKYKGLHSQSSQRVLEELAEGFNSWYGKRKTRVVRVVEWMVVRVLSVGCTSVKRVMLRLTLM